jgi:hypothetical protein
VGTRSAGTGLRARAVAQQELRPPVVCAGVCLCWRAAGGFVLHSMVCGAGTAAKAVRLGVSGF